MNREVRIGTRASALALWQAHYVKDFLLKVHPQLKIKIITITTQGDRILDKSLNAVGGKGLFVKEIEYALLNRQVDLAVHSFKDLPAEMPPGLILGAVPPREDFRDAWVCPSGHSLSTLPPGSKVGTSSLRRRAQLLKLRPDLQVIDLRGNVDTRLRKVKQGYQGLSAAILAAAGLKRLGYEEQITEYLDPERFVPAIAQGALAIQIRFDDALLYALLKKIHHPETWSLVQAERSLLKNIFASCHVPLGALASRLRKDILLHARLASEDGRDVIDVRVRGVDPIELGREAAQQLIAQSSDYILQSLDFSPSSSETLKDIPILLTAYPERNALLSEQIRMHGGIPIDLPLIQLKALASKDIELAIERLVQNHYDWAVFTSANGVDKFFEHLVGKALDGSVFDRLRVAAIGPKTALALQQREVKVHLIPPQGRESAEGLLQALIHAGLQADQKILFPSASQIRPVLVQGLRALKVQVDRIPVYQTQPLSHPPLSWHAIFKQYTRGYVIFGNSSSIRYFMKEIQDLGLQEALRSWTIACIGSITAQTARDHGLEIGVMPKASSYSNLIQAVIQHAQDPSSIR